MLTAKRLNTNKPIKDYFIDVANFLAYAVNVLSFLQVVIQPFLVLYFSVTGNYQLMFLSMLLTFFFMYLNKVFSNYFGGNY